MSMSNLAQAQSNFISGIDSQLESGFYIDWVMKML